MDIINTGFFISQELNWQDLSAGRKIKKIWSFQLELLFERNEVIIGVRCDFSDLLLQSRECRQKVSRLARQKTGLAGKG